MRQLIAPTNDRARSAQTPSAPLQASSVLRRGVEHPGWPAIHLTAERRPPPRGFTALTTKESRFVRDFSTVPPHSDMRGSASASESDFTDQRFGRGSDDPVHQPVIDLFRQQQGQPSGGVDAEGNQVGPTDAEIKYRPQPIAVLNGPFHAPIDEPGTVGMEIAIKVQSSDGNNASMASVQDSERVSLSFAHTGSFAGVAPIPSSQSGFMPAVNIPNDRHGAPRAFIVDRADNHGGSGSFSKHQLDIYTHSRYGIFNPIPISNSGYRITRTIISSPGNPLKFRLDKSPEACTVDGFSTTAGPSPAQHDEVILRP